MSLKLARTNLPDFYNARWRYETGERMWAGLPSGFWVNDILSGYVERVTWRQLRIGENRRGLLGEDGLSEKQED
jgi:hypothetical protein